MMLSSKKQIRCLGSKGRKVVDFQNTLHISKSNRLALVVQLFLGLMCFLQESVTKKKGGCCATTLKYQRDIAYFTSVIL